MLGPSDVNGDANQSGRPDVAYKVKQKYTSELRADLIAPAEHDLHKFPELPAADRPSPLPSLRVQGRGPEPRRYQLFSSRRWSGPMRGIAGLSWKLYRRSHDVTRVQVSQASWRKSSFSSMNGSCVEIGRLRPDRIGVRDTKDNGTGPVLFFTDSEWRAFIAGAKAGQFDKF